MGPTVSFVVPCYNFAHLLPECVNSILMQTFEDYEVLIMDDCSPDHTAEVASSFKDSRVNLVRNEQNLGNLRNFNKGIQMSRGKYVWLISADDCLLSRRILQRYVTLMEANPSVGYVFCPAVGLEEGKETGVLKYSRCGDRDAVFKGHEFLKTLLKGDCVVASSGMVREECYQRLGVFPLDLPYAGDWYMWCRLALVYDVAYLAEPMVCYRQHELSMTTLLLQERHTVCIQDDMAVPWRILHDAVDMKLPSVVRKCENVVAREYAFYVSGPHRRSLAAIGLKEINLVMGQYSRNASELRRIRSRMFAILADGAYERHDRNAALRWYRLAIKENPGLLEMWMKLFLLKTGKIGALPRSGLGAIRRTLTRRSGRVKERA